jgi:hypothetical protein
MMPEVSLVAASQAIDMSRKSEPALVGLLMIFVIAVRFGMVFEEATLILAK